MRYFVSLLIFALALTVMLYSCSGVAERDRLAYQDGHLYVEADFIVDGEPVTASLDIEATEYDGEGRMLSRDTILTLGENSIISGVSFIFTGGEAYVSSGELKIPIKDDGVISGITDIISLFCISPDSYYSSEMVTEGGLECERCVYINGENRVEVLLDLSCELPVSINAVIDGRELSADIKLIKVE